MGAMGRQQGAPLEYVTPLHVLAAVSIVKYGDEKIGILFTTGYEYCTLCNHHTAVGTRFCIVLFEKQRF